MGKQWTPPSDAVPVENESSWTPPSDAVKKKEPTTSQSESVKPSTGSVTVKQEAWQGLGASDSFGTEVAKAHAKTMPDKRPQVFSGYPGKDGFEYKLSNGQWQFRKKIKSTGKDNIFDVFSSSDNNYTSWQNISDPKRSVALDAHFLDGNTLSRMATKNEMPKKGEMPAREIPEQPKPEDYYLTDFGQKNAFTGIRDLSAQKQVAQDNLAGLIEQKNKDLAAAITPEQKNQVEAQYAPLTKQASMRVDDIVNTETSMKEGFAKLMQQPEPTAYDRKRQILLGAITEDLIALPEGNVVDGLVDLFENAGPEFDMFDFEEVGVGDFLRITNKRSGESIDISLANQLKASSAFSQIIGMGSQEADDPRKRNKIEANLLKGWVQLALDSGDYYDKLDAVKDIRSKIDALPEWDSVNRMELQKQLIQANTDLKIAEKKRHNMALSNPGMANAVYNKYKRQEVSGEVFRIQESATRLNADISDANKWYQAAAENYRKGNISEQEWQDKWQPEIDEKMAEFRKRQSQIEMDAKDVASKQSTLEELAALRTVALQDRGNVLSGMGKSFTSGAVAVAEFLGGERFGERPGSEDIGNVNPYDWHFGIVSDEYLKSENRSGFERLLFGMSRSLGASTFGTLATGGMPVGGYLGVYAMSYRDMQDQIDDLISQGADISDGEKFMLSSIYGMTVGMLEKYGLSKSFSKSPLGKKFLNWLMVSTFKDLPKGASADMIEEYMKKNILAATQKKLIGFAGAGVIEGSTEGAQEMADASLKKVYNLFKDKEVFEEYDTWGDFAESVGSASAWGAVGGHMMHLAGGSGRILKSGIKDSGMLDVETNLFMSSLADPEFRSMLSDNVKIAVMNGEMTQQEGEQTLQDYDRAVGILSEIPPTSSRDVALSSYDLLIEKHNLEGEIAGKDPATVKYKIDRIAAINEELQNISQNDKENVQGVSSEEQVGEKPVEAKPIEKTSGGATKTGGDVQALEEVTPVAEEVAPVAEKTEPAAEEAVPNYNDAVSAAMDKFNLSQERGSSKEAALESALGDLQKNDWYKNADDVAREKAYREVREKAGFKEKKAPSVKKLSGTKDKTVTVNERTALRDQIVFEAREARNAAKSETKARKDVARKILPMFGNYKMSTGQSRSIMRAALTSNLSNPVMADRFVDYVQKVLADAEYNDKLKKATLHKKHVSAFSKSKEQLPEMRGVLKAFAAINPRYITNIDEYIEMAEKAKSAARSTRKVPGGLQIRNTGVVPEVAEYTKKTLEKQEIIEKNRLQEEHPELFAQGVLSPDMSVKEMHEIIKSIGSEGGPRISNDADITKRARQVFESYAGIMKTMLDTGIDPMSGDKVTLTAAQKRGAQALLDIDIAAVDQKTLFNLVDSIGSLVNNGFVGNIDAITSYIQGGQNAAKWQKENGKAPKMSSVLRGYDFQMATLPVFLDTLLRGVERGISFMDVSGISGIIRGASTARKKSTDILNEYVNTFFKKNPNGKSFNDASNIYERGAVAFLSRNIQGSDIEMQNEFKRRVRLINETIEHLNGPRASSIEKSKGKVYTEIQKKLGLLDENVTLEKVMSRVDPTNIQAVEWWVNQWAEHYDQLREVSMTVYGKDLPSDINFTPDRFKAKQSDSKAAENLEDMGAFSEFNDTAYHKESGSLMENKRVNILPTNRYVDLDFDLNNHSAIEAALIDVSTASDIRKVMGFMKSDAYNDMFYAEDKAAVSDRILNYIKRTRNKDIPDNSRTIIFKKITNSMARVGTTMALGGIDQIPKQTIPVAVNTLINAGRFDIHSTFSKEFWDWLASSGMPIAERGWEARTSIDVAEKRLNKITSVAGKANKGFEAVTDLWLKLFLVKPDKFIAGASFLSYYRQNLYRRGLDTNFDFNAPIDQEAANYAQHMVDRQQNVSDSNLAGELFASKHWSMDVLRKIYFPFSNFIMNQRTRMLSDVKTLSSRTASAQDRRTAIRSLSGLGSELAAFTAVSMYLRSIYTGIIEEYMGYDPEKEDKGVTAAVDKENKRRLASGMKEMNESEERAFRREFYRNREGRRNKQTFITSIVKDAFSPFPPADDFIVWGLNKAISASGLTYTEHGKEANEAVRIENEIRGEKMNPSQESKFRASFVRENAFQLDEYAGRSSGLGVMQIPLNNYDNYRALVDASNGTVTVRDSRGNEDEKYVVGDDKEAANLGKWMLLFSGTLAPADAGKEATRILTHVKKKSLTATQFEEYKALKKLRNGKEPSAEEISKIRNGVKADEILSPDSNIKGSPVQGSEVRGSEVKGSVVK